MRWFTRLALAAFAVASFGCNLPEGPTPSGSSSSSTGTINSQGTMSAVIGNIPWNANARVTATYSRAQNAGGASILNVSGTDVPLSAMLSLTVSSVSLGTDLTPGTFPIGTTGTSATLTDSLGT